MTSRCPACNCETIVSFERTLTDEAKLGGRSVGDIPTTIAGRYETRVTWACGHDLRGEEWVDLSGTPSRLRLTRR